MITYRPLTGGGGVVVVVLLSISILALLTDSPFAADTHYTPALHQVVFVSLVLPLHVRLHYQDYFQTHYHSSFSCSYSQFLVEYL